MRTTALFFPLAVWSMLVLGSSCRPVKDSQANAKRDTPVCTSANNGQWACIPDRAECYNGAWLNYPCDSGLVCSNGQCLWPYQVSSTTSKSSTSSTKTTSSVSKTTVTSTTTSKSTTTTTTTSSSTTTKTTSTSPAGPTITSWTFHNWNGVSGQFPTWNLLSSANDIPQNREWVSDPEDPSTTVFRVNYPANSYGFGTGSGNCGTGFYAEPLNPSVYNTADYVEMEFQVYFPENFPYVKGGKLPGLYGGHTSCSGGNNADDCYSMRYMWRTPTANLSEGTGEAYLYVPTSNEPSICQDTADNCADIPYGLRMADNSFYWVNGQWNKVKFAIKFNTGNNADGILKLYKNDQQVYEFDSIIWKTSNTNVTTLGIEFQTFFGGSSTDWATPIDTYLLFKEFQITVSQNAV